MKAKYSTLCGGFEDFITKMEDVLEWRNVRVVYEHYKQKMAQDVLKRRKVDDNKAINKLGFVESLDGGSSQQPSMK